jgi:ketosteroid isomerase-like protein
MANTTHQFARDFFASFFTGTIKAEYLTDDFSAWTTLGPMDKASYLGALKQVISLFAGGKGSFSPVIDHITAEGDRVVVEVHSKGTFTDGEGYEMTYVFVLKLRDGKVAWLAEHFNPLPVLEKMLPRMQQAPGTLAKAS